MLPRSPTRRCGRMRRRPRPGAWGSRRWRQRERTGGRGRSAARFDAEPLQQRVEVRAGDVEPHWHPSRHLDYSALRMPGITRLATYFPRRRLDRALIAQAWGGRTAPGGRPAAAVDEDALTMAVDAALACLGDADPATMDALYFASTSAPYLEKQVASVVATAADLPRAAAVADFAGSARAGLAALRAACDAVVAGSRVAPLVVAADVRQAEPGSDLEPLLGDGAAAAAVAPGRRRRRVDRRRRRLGGVHLLLAYRRATFAAGRRRPLRQPVRRRPRRPGCRDRGVAPGRGAGVARRDAVPRGSRRPRGRRCRQAHRVRPGDPAAARPRHRHAGDAPSAGPAGARARIGPPRRHPRRRRLRRGRGRAGVPRHGGAPDAPAGRARGPARGWHRRAHVRALAACPRRLARRHRRRDRPALHRVEGAQAGRPTLRQSLRGVRARAVPASAGLRRAAARATV